MARPFTPKVLTANRLIEGDVVYYGADGWVLRLRDALLITNETDANALLAQANTQPDLYVGAYLADAQEIDGVPAPTHFREEFRRTGPSNYAHGKQTEV